MTVRDALREGAAALAGSETPFLDASLLLAAALETDTTHLLASGPDELPDTALGRYRSGLDRRERGLPVAYILGYREFYGRRFSVDERVLIPRPDTETLVEIALQLGDIILRELRALPGEYDDRHLRPRVHDCCTGSGCVAISIAAERPGWEVSASDLSEAALEVASANAAALLDRDRPGGPLALFRSDLLSGARPGSYDIIIANPPYVGSSETDALLARGWSEPRQALDGGLDGLDLIRRLVPESFLALAAGGVLLVEADEGQAGEIAELFRASRFEGIEHRLDLGGKARVALGRKPWTS